MNNTARDVIYLAACAVNEAVPDKARVDGMDLERVYACASRHMITAAVAYALESAGYRDGRSTNAIAAAVRKTAVFDSAWGDIREKLEAAGIWYMPLKGAVLKELYPKYGMREFADHDILFDAARAADVKAIMEALGFTTEMFGASVHDVYHKPPVLSFEMHTALFGPSHEERLYEYYRNVENRLIVEKGCGRHFTPEDLYLYCLAHEYKHYSNGGTGLRSLMDTWVYLDRVKLDMDYVDAEAKKLGLGDFEKRNRSLATHLFGRAELTEADREMLDYILASGTYGTTVHRVQNRLRKNGWSKFQYMLSRFSIPVSRKDKRYENYASTYPAFYRHKILLPLLPFYRLFRAIKAGRFGAEAKALRNA